MTSKKQRRISKTSSGVASKPASVEPSVPFDEWLAEQLKDPAEAAAYVDAVIEEGSDAALMLALRQVAMAQGGIAALARRAKVTREAAYRMLSESGNPELRSLTAILKAAGLRLSVKSISDPPTTTQKRGRRELRTHGIRPFPRRGNVVTNELVDKLREDDPH
jgi:probable addiction module antidote protein